MRWLLSLAVAASVALSGSLAFAQAKPPQKPAKLTPQEQKLEAYKTEAVASNAGKAESASSKGASAAR